MEADERPVVVIIRPRPREVLLDVFFLISAVGFFAGVNPPTNIESQVEGPWRWLWYSLLFVGGVLMLVSNLRRRWYQRLIIERAGCWASAAGALIFAVAAFAYAGGAALFSAGFMIAWAVAQGWRIMQIGRELHGH